MKIVNIIKEKLSSIRSSEENSLEDFQHILSQCDAKISELEGKLLKAQKENESLKQSSNSNDIEIAKLKQIIEKQKKNLISTNSANEELRNSNLNLIEENELLVGRSSNVVLKLIHFCGLLNTMDISSVEDCIAIIKNEIEQTTTEMGFEIIDCYEGEFNSEIHCIIGTQETADTLLNNHIAKVVRPGVWYDNKCIIPQDVIVYTVNQERCTN